jgi:hypothetical protein
MNHHNVILAALAVTALFGCATTPSPQVADSQDDKAYVTGSRLPVRDGGTSADVKGVGNKDAVDDLRRGSVYIPPKGGPM